MAFSMQWVAPPSPPPPHAFLLAPHPIPFQIGTQLRLCAWMQILRSLDIPDRNAVVTAPLRSCTGMHRFTAYGPFLHIDLHGTGADRYNTRTQRLQWC